MRVQRLALLGLGQLGDHLVRRAERVLSLGQQLDESGVALEELGELFPGQLPR
jgi:hypothetical protein